MIVTWRGLTSGPALDRPVLRRRRGSGGRSRRAPSTGARPSDSVEPSAASSAAAWATAVSRSRASAVSVEATTSTVPVPARPVEVHVDVAGLRGRDPALPRPGPGRRCRGLPGRASRSGPRRPCARPRRAAGPRAPHPRPGGASCVGRSGRPATTAGHRPPPAARSSGSRYGDLEHLTDVPAARVDRHPEDGGELDDRELRDARRARTGQRETGVPAVLHHRRRLAPGTSWVAQYSITCRSIRTSAASRSALSARTASRRATCGSPSNSNTVAAAITPIQPAVTDIRGPPAMACGRARRWRQLWTLSGPFARG